MATLDSDDLKAIEKLIELKMETVIEKRQLVTKDDMSHLPTKDDFYGKMNEAPGELKDVREGLEVKDRQQESHRIDP